jgi:hypothetical protein
VRRAFRFAALGVFALALLAACSAGGSSIPGGVPQAAVARPEPHVPFARHVFFSRRYRSALRRINAVEPLEYHGGPVQVTPIVYLVFWGIASTSDTTDDPFGMAQYLVDFFSSTGGSTWIATDTQYYDTAGALKTFVQNPTAQYGGAYYDASPPPSATYTDAQVRNEAIKAAGKLGYHLDANYVVVTPHDYTTPGFAATYSSANAFCAYHSATFTSGKMLSYTTLPYLPDAGYSCGAASVPGGTVLDGASIVGGHEEAETQTDPDASSGWLDASGNEVADKCAWMNLQSTAFPDGKSFPTQPLWSNATDSCVQAYSVGVPTPTPTPRQSPTPTPTPTPLANAIVNGGFETGRLAPWKSCRSGVSLPTPDVTTTQPHSGKYDVFMGDLKGTEPNGTTAVCQEVRVPAGGVLSAWVRGVSNDPNPRVYEFGALYETTGNKMLKTLYTSKHNDATWKRRQFLLSQYGGRLVRVTFGVVGTNDDFGKTVGLYLDDVSLTHP